ncbi:hypothetical protein DET61_12028 [Marinobacter nauticus]|uniref:Uncharacterized protein n=1 Tax=Marinobacter nauticus TaxID=2743 RepID=A0A368X6U5_MARNT|nr:hypothetical protein [Marinobacter nauticus]RCW62906.1 hypothetical protein DET61_12028 [Marinobacter nauticus]
MKTAFRALALVLFASVSEISLAAEPEPLEPITRPRVVFWESENFVFTVHDRCTVDFDGLFASRRCDGATIYVESSLTFDDQRLESIKNGRNGERELKDTDIAFSVQGKKVFDWSASGDWYGSYNGSPRELVAALRRDPASTVTLRYPVGTIKDITPPNLGAWGQEQKKPAKAKHRNQYETVSFQLKGFAEAADTVEDAAMRVARSEMIGINILLAGVYILLVVVTVATIRFLSRKAIDGTKKTASKLEESRTERRIHNETMNLHIQEEAQRRFKAERLKIDIQEALAADDHDKAQTLMAKLKKLQK